MGIEATDIAMRIVSFVGGIVALIETVMMLLGTQLAFWNFGWIGGLVGIICGLLALFLAIKPITLTPFFLGVICVALLVFAVIIGGIVVGIACAIGAFT